MDDIYKNIEEYNLNKKRKILIVFDDMIVDMFSNKKLNSIGTELFIRGRKLNISLVFIIQSYFAVPKNIRLNSSHYFITKISNKRELQKISFNHSWSIDFPNFWPFDLWLFLKIVLKIHFLFWLLILLLNQIILQVSERIFRNNMKTNHENWDDIRDKNVQYDIYREVEKVSAITSGKIDKMEFLQVKKY